MALTQAVKQLRKEQQRLQSELERVVLRFKQQLIVIISNTHY